MAFLVEINNPFKPLEDSRAIERPGGFTIWEYLTDTRPGFEGFASPHIIVVNGEAILQKDWRTRIIAEKDVVNIVALAQGPVWLFAAFAVLSVASVVIALSIPKPGTPGQTPEADPTYDIKGQNNQNRLGKPIEDAYGRCRLFPSYAARPYNRYLNNDQFQYQLFSLGHGEFELEEPMIEDTPISNFSEVEYKFYEAGEVVDMFPDNVITSVEVAGIEMKASNEDDFEVVGPFVANPPGTETTRLEVDVVFPGGLYWSNDKGGLDNLTATGKFECQQIDDSGNPLTGWFPLVSFSKTLRTNTPQRFTLGADVVAGRWQVRGERTGLKLLEARATSTFKWDQLRAFLPSTKVYPVPTLAVAIRATDNLNDRSSHRVNCWATRKLPIWDGDEWSENTATRNPVWAICNVIRASYGGQLDASFIDLEKLLTLAEFFETNEIWFDFVFDQRITVWEALKTIGFACRSIPIPEGSQITLIRDDPQTIVKAAFSPWNIVKDSFEYEISPAKEDEFDGLEVTYVDENTWTEDTMLCLVDGEAGDRPEQVRLYGVTNRDKAYQLGLYMRARKKRLRENVKFTTGLEGHIPSYNDLVLVNHDAPKWGQAGEVVAIDPDNVTLTLSNSVIFGVGTHIISFSKKDGSYHDEVNVTAGSHDKEVVLSTPIDPTDFYFDNVHERPRFYFGVAGMNGVRCIITSLAPAANNQVAVTAVVYGNVYDFDKNPAPGAPPVPMPPKPGAPVIDCSLVTIEPIPGIERYAMLTWPPALGATSYRVETSTNGEDWSLVSITAALFQEIPVEPGAPMFARVQALSTAGAGGAFCEATDNGENPEPPLPTDAEGLEYPDIIGNTPILRTCYCKTQAVTATYCGFPEFNYKDGKFYKEIEFSGTRGGTVWDIPSAPEGNLCGGTYVGKFTVEWTGTASWDVDTCKVTATGTQTVKEYNSLDTLFNTVVTDLTGSESQLYGNPVTINCSNDQIRSDVEFKHQTNGECCVSLADKLAQIADGFTEAKSSNEDTAEAAMERAFDATGEDLEDQEYALCNGDGTLPCCWSIWEKANGGSTFLVQKAKFKTVFENLQAGGASHVDFFVYRYNHDTGEHTLESTEELDSFASIDGEVEFEYELPLEQGFSFYIGGMKLSIL